MSFVLTATPAVARGRKDHPPPPPEWQEDVLPFVEFVEKTRGFEFDHPVDVLLLSDRAFERRSGFDGGAGLGFLIRQLATLGLVSADDRVDDFDGGTLFGYFDFFSEQVVVRGDDINDPYTRMVLVHELSHALVYERFGDFTSSESAGTFALQTLVEGDATAVHEDYVSSLGERAVERIRSTEADIEASLDAPSVPAVLGAAPYAIGAAYVEVLEALGTRNRVFRNPPVFDDQVLDPLAVSSGSGERRPTPRLPLSEPTDERRGPRGALGQVLVFLTLAARLDLKTSLDAALGWNADSSRVFRRDGRDCIVLSVHGVTAHDTDELRTAFGAWAAARPSGSAVVTTDEDGDVLVTSCETPGPVTSVNDLAAALSYVLAGRLYWSVEALGAGEEPAVARCVGDAVALDPEVMAAEARAHEAGRGFRQLDAADRTMAKVKLEQATRMCRAVA